MNEPRPPLIRKVIALPADLWLEVSDYRHAMKISTEAAAVRTLLTAALRTLGTAPIEGMGGKRRTRLRR